MSRGYNSRKKNMNREVKLSTLNYSPAHAEKLREKIQRNGRAIQRMKDRKRKKEGFENDPEALRMNIDEELHQERVIEHNKRTAKVIQDFKDATTIGNKDGTHNHTEETTK